jgi:hypothetical protein
MTHFSSSTNLPETLEGSVFSKEIFEFAGLFIIRNTISSSIISELQTSWNTFYQKLLQDGLRKIDKNNLVNFNDTLPN